MTQTISNQRMLMDVVFIEGNMKLQGSASVNTSGEVKDFNTNIQVSDTHVGHVNYNESNGVISKNINCPADKEAEVFALLTASILLLKEGQAE